MKISINYICLYIRMYVCIFILNSKLSREISTKLVNNIDEDEGKTISSQIIYISTHLINISIYLNIISILLIICFNIWRKEILEDKTLLTSLRVKRLNDISSCLWNEWCIFDQIMYKTNSLYGKILCKCVFEVEVSPLNVWVT